MKRILLTLFLIIITLLLVTGYPLKEKIQSVFKQNIGFDDLSRTIEVSISQNSIAAPVFNMKNDRKNTLEVFSGTHAKE